MAIRELTLSVRFMAGSIGRSTSMSLSNICGDDSASAQVLLDEASESDAPIHNALADTVITIDDSIRLEILNRPM
jgi:hypothetical protein